MYRYIWIICIIYILSLSIIYTYIYIYIYIDRGSYPWILLCNQSINIQTGSDLQVIIFRYIIILQVIIIRYIIIPLLQYNKDKLSKEAKQLTNKKNKRINGHIDKHSNRKTAKQIDYHTNRHKISICIKIKEG